MVSKLLDAEGIQGPEGSDLYPLLQSTLLIPSFFSSIPGTPNALKLTLATPHFWGFACAASFAWNVLPVPSTLLIPTHL